MSEPIDFEESLSRLPFSPRDGELIEDTTSPVPSPESPNGHLEVHGAMWLEEGQEHNIDDYIEKSLGEPIVVINDLIKEYHIPGGDEVVRALGPINLNEISDIYPIRRGEFVMILGPSGGGKTTLLNIIGTVDAPSSGSVTIFNEKITNEQSDSYLAKLRSQYIGYVFQTFNLLPTMSAYENVCLPMIIEGCLTKSQIHEKALYLLHRVGLTDRTSHLPSELSGGEQQRVAIARSLANDPQLVILDEPTGDLDTRNTIEVMDLLLELNLDRDHPVTFIMVTHNPDLQLYADRVLFIEDGQFKRQCINTTQMRLDFDRYVEHIGNVYGEKTSVEDEDEDEE